MGANDKHDRVWRFIEEERGLFEHGFIVGEFSMPFGLRLTRQLVFQWTMHETRGNKANLVLEKNGTLREVLFPFWSPKLSTGELDSSPSETAVTQERKVMIAKSH